MSGIELHRQLLSLGSEVPVIHVTAHEEPAVRTEAQAVGCAGFFRKTDPGSEILASIDRVVRKKRGRA